MALTFSTDKNNDIFIGKDGNLSLSRGIDAVLQTCAQTAKAQLGEMVLAIDRGIPYFETVLNGVPNIPQFEAALRSAFLDVTNVIEVVSLIVSRESDNKGNKSVLVYRATIRTDFGEGTIDDRFSTDL